MKILNKKERSVSMWKFFGIATIPLLLSLLAGYSWGHSSGMEQENYKELSNKNQKQYATLEKDITAIQKFISFSDSIVTEGLSDAKTWDSDLKQSINEDLSEDVWADIRENYDQLNEAISEEYLSLNNKSDLNDIAKKTYNSYKKLIRLRKSFSQIVRDKALLSKGMGQQIDFDEKAEEHDEEVDDLNDKIDELESDLDRANDKLADCKEDKTELNQKLAEGSTGPVLPDNSGSVSKIKEELETIQTAIIPSMQGKFLNNNKSKLNQLREELRSHLAVIADAVNDVE